MKRRDIIKGIGIAPLAVLASKIAVADKQKAIGFQGREITMTIGGKPVEGVKSKALAINHGDNAFSADQVRSLVKQLNDQRLESIYIS